MDLGPQPKTLGGVIRKRLVTGTLVIVPFVVTIVLLKWIFDWAAGFLRPALMELLGTILTPEQMPKGQWVDPVVSSVAVILLLILIYFVGVVTRAVIGRKMIGAGEGLMLRIPVVKSIFGATRQVVQNFSVPDRKSFRSVVLVEFPRPGFKAIGFLTGFVNDSAGRTWCKLFIPTAPNPTTGFFELVPPEELQTLHVTFEEAFKMIISGGIIAPDSLSLSPVEVDGPAAPGPLPASDKR